MEQEELNKLMKANPDLTSYGFETKRSGDYKKNREWLRTSLKEVNRCIEWLNEHMNNLPKNVLSYDLKHKVEKDTNPHMYIGNGMMIAAIIYLRIPYHRYAHHASIDNKL